MSIPSHFLPMRLETVWAGVALNRHLFRPLLEFQPEWLFDPDLWVHVANKLRVDYEMLVLPQDGEYRALLYVKAIDPRGLWVEMGLDHGSPAALWEPLMKAPPPRDMNVSYPDADGYTVEWGGPAHRFRIVDRSGIVAKDFSDKATAVDALARIKAAKPARAA